MNLLQWMGRGLRACPIGKVQPPCGAMLRATSSVECMHRVSAVDDFHSAGRGLQMRGTSLPGFVGVVIGKWADRNCLLTNRRQNFSDERGDSCPLPNVEKT